MSTEPLLLSFGLRPFPGLVDERGRAVPEGSLKVRMREILHQVDAAGYEIGRVEPGADFQDFWEDALRIAATTTAADEAGLTWINADPRHRWQPEEMSRRLGPVTLLEEHHSRDRLAGHALMRDPAVTGRYIHTATYNDSHELADLETEQICYLTHPGELAELDARYASDLVTLLRWMYWQGHQDAVVKVDGLKLGMTKVMLTDNADDLREQLTDDRCGLGWTMIRLEGVPEMFRVCAHIPMTYEYRLFVVDGRIVTGAGCIEENTPLSHDTSEGVLDPWMRATRGNGIAADLGGDSEPEYQPGRARWYAHWAQPLLDTLPEGQNTLVMDVATSGDRDDPVLVEFNALPNAGLFACDIDALATAVVGARERGYWTRAH